jgi:replicative DNA helicase
MTNSRAGFVKSNTATPYSEDAEKGLVASLLLGGHNVSAELGIMVRDAHFMMPAHSIMWRTAHGLLAQRKGTDFALVKQRLMDAGELDEIGGVPILSELYGFVPTWHNFRHYAEIVLDKYLLRQAISGANHIMRLAQNPGEEGFGAVRQEIEQTLTALTIATVRPDRTAKEITLEWLDDIEHRAERLKESGIEFGLATVDETVGPQRPGECTAIGAEISGGKSLFAAQGALHNMQRGRAVALASMEMSEIQYWDRMASYLQQISMKSLRRGRFTEAELRAIGLATTTLGNLPLQYSQGVRGWDGLKAFFRRAKANHGVTLGIIDYLQRVRVNAKGMRFAKREEEMTYLSNEVKDLAMELDMCFWYPIQLNDDGLARESRMIMADADNAIKIVNDHAVAKIKSEKKPETQNWSDREKKINHTLIVTKARQSERQVFIPARILGEYMTVEEREQKPAND